MGRRHLLYFTAEDHYLYSARGSALELEARFPADEHGLTEFRQYLRQRQDFLISVIADVAGEDFHEDQIPLLRGADRRAVVQRRLAQRYRDTRLAAALSLGTAASAERRNERLLLASFTNTQPFAAWLETLQQSGARLAGFYSVPLLAPALAARLAGRAGRCLLVSANRAGLRQCLVEEGRLRFARLERTVEMVPQALAMFVRSETLRLAQYLVTLRALPREGAPIRVVVVAPAGQKAVFEQVLSSDARLAFETIELEEAARRVGLRRRPEGGGAEALYLHMAAKKPPQQQFATQDDRRRYRFWQLQRSVVAAGAAGLAACALYAGAVALEAARVREQAALEARAAAAAAQEYKDIASRFPVTRTSAENLKATVDEFQRMAQRTALPESAFLHVSRVLEQFPDVEIDALRWSIGPAENGERAAKPPGAGATAPPRAASSTVRLEINGHIATAVPGDYRGITARVQRLGEALSADGYALVRTELPFDITSQGTLSGDMIGSVDSREPPRFTLELARRQP